MSIDINLSGKSPPLQVGAGVSDEVLRKLCLKQEHQSL